MLVDLEGQQAIDFLCYNAHDSHERYPAPNTVKLQGWINDSSASICTAANLASAAVLKSYAERSEYPAGFTEEGNLVSAHERSVVSNGVPNRDEALQGYLKIVLRYE